VPLARKKIEAIPEQQDINAFFSFRGWEAVGGA
jgi:hypothetical protein